MRKATATATSTLSRYFKAEGPVRRYATAIPIRNANTEAISVETAKAAASGTTSVSSSNGPVAFPGSRMEKIIKFLEQKNEPKFRVKQVCDAIFNKYVKSYNEITVLPQALRTSMQESLGNILQIEPVSVDVSEQATKTLFKLHDGRKIEAVKMNFLKGQTSLCISSQAGCAFACKFCATGAIGFYRHLTADEITDQILYFQQQGLKIDSVAFMGMGEPLINPNVFKALEMLSDEKQFNMSLRRFSISTVGVIPGIARITRDFPQVNLAFSLHTPFSEERDVLMPANKNYPVESVFEALDEHVAKTHRKLFIAYLLLEGSNDSIEHAKAIIDLIHKRPAHLRHLYHLNVLRYNPAFGIGDLWPRTDEKKLESFMAILRDAGISVTARQSFGVDIDAACGQLFAKNELKKRAARGDGGGAGAGAGATPTTGTAATATTHGGQQKPQQRSPCS
eukprot:GEZU01008745.1.p1 GENE.GEZU01008745.1~~GEZU01008745.1.p1  ORF type:complete len:451 (+),score=97.48 GEZU01008745.1:8-1360(+)